MLDTDRNAPRGEVGENLGYHGCMAVACESGGRRPKQYFSMAWIGNSDKHAIIAESVALQSHLSANHEQTSERIVRR